MSLATAADTESVYLFDHGGGATGAVLIKGDHKKARQLRLEISCRKGWIGHERINATRLENAFLRAPRMAAAMGYDCIGMTRAHPSWTNTSNAGKQSHGKSKTS